MQHEKELYSVLPHSEENIWSYVVVFFPCVEKSKELWLISEICKEVEKDEKISELKINGFGSHKKYTYSA